MKNLIASPLLFVFFTMLFSCHSHHVTSAGKVKQQTVTTNQSHSYLLYLPANYDSTKAYPVIFSFDSHGSGKMAIDGFIKAADTYGFVLVGSNIIRNGIQDYDKRIDELKTDVNTKVKVAAAYYAGFSGGSRMALYYGIQKQGMGVIACGASMPLKTIQQTLTTAYIYNIAGTQDFNYDESFYVPGSSESVTKRYLTATFIGKHEWPSSVVLSEAVAFMYVRAVIDKAYSETYPLSDICKEKQAQIDSLIKTNHLYAAYAKAEESTKMFSGACKEQVFNDIQKKIEQMPAFATQNNDLLQALQFEQMLDNGYKGSIQNESAAWWTNELKALNDTILHKKPGITLDMLYRVKGFIGILCYSMVNSAVQKNDLPLLAKLNSVYEVVEPANPDVFYYKSLYFLKTNRTDSAYTAMKKAFELGFCDTVRLCNDFPKDVAQRFTQPKPQSHNK